MLTDISSEVGEAESSPKDFIAFENFLNFKINIILSGFFYF